MGNNQGGGGIQPPTGERAKQRRPSTADPVGPLEVPMGVHRYNVDLTPPHPSQAAFTKNLVNQMNVDPEEEFIKQNITGSNAPDEYTRRYRAGSISLEPSHRQAASKTMPIVMKWNKDGKDVAVSGSFNKWEKKIPLVKSEKNFYTIIEVSEGEHQYKFYVDGVWRHNPDEPTTKAKDGALNNVMKVSKDDFEFWNALESDREATAAAVTKKATTGDIQDRQRHNTSDSTGDDNKEEYGQEIPVNKGADRRTGPPVLPPHLLQVILNKDVSERLEPGLLPEPNHVMLNHLYALSIKDGVMVLSDTSRYKKKYVTTLLYKPID